MSENGRLRLTSWKEIARHLGREVRTVLRWEKERGLPVYRVPGGSRRVVFAYTDELDAWSRGEAKPESAEPDAAESVPAPRTATPRWIAIAAAAGLVVLAAGLGAWRARGSATDQPVGVVMTDRALIARGADGSEKWRHEFHAETTSPPFARSTFPVEPLPGEGVLAATGLKFADGTRAIRSGELLWFDPAGTVKRTFSFDDAVTYGSRVYSAPWSLNDYQVDGGPGDRRIAVTSSHEIWWPSIVTILDGQWRRQASFVHAGWVEFVRWLPGNRLAISGFSNLKDGGMVALLEADAMNGQSPAPPQSEFHCAGCGPDRPARYVVLPRSEVNRVSVAPFNRASVAVRANTLIVFTVERPQTATTVQADAVYEFTRQLDLVHASYSDRYWDAHRELERLGRIAHTRDRCPDREGPAHIEIWEPATGWRVQPITRLMASRQPAR